MSTVYVVHAIDTEGPLYEPLSATFERIEYISGHNIDPTRQNLEKLRKGEINLDGDEDLVATIVSPNLLDYNDSWEKIEIMLQDMMSESYRLEVPDSFGSGWVYNWYCTDHIGYSINPRCRDIGYHNIFDRYLEYRETYSSPQDGMYLHYHPMPPSRQAHHNANTWLGGLSDSLFQVLARRIIDKSWFPCSNRPGFHVTRPDSHWFLEQYIPFDYANQACDEETVQADLADGRFGDWRRAPKSWHPYHPHHDDYQTLGDCRRWIFRVLNLGTRMRTLTQDDTDQAFAEAAEGSDVVLSFANHDFRDMRPDVSVCREMLMKAQSKYPDVKFKYSDARDAARAVLKLEPVDHLKLSIAAQGDKLVIESDRPTFGPQPFLAIRTVAGEYIHQNLDFDQPFRKWSYVLDEQTLPMQVVDKVGVASCDETGNVTVTQWRRETGETESKHW